MKKNLVAVAFAAATMLSTAAGAATLDDFNRPDAATLGSGWTQQSGSSSIVDGKATGSSLSLATFNGGSGNTVSFDLSSLTSGTSYIAAVLGYGAGDNYFIKVQNNGGGAFNTYGFYTGNNNSTGIFSSLNSTFTSAHVTASFVGTVATLTIDPTGGTQQVYTYDYRYTPGGTGIGLGFYGAAAADNFGSGAAGGAVPEPATWALMILGFGVVGGAMRRRKAEQLATIAA
ncbi:PEPxxWA-CTERM sorting domain-containing protein [Sphingomonas sp. TX0543]|uniref:PEPxxWA-CTERM sorting domain-containing protein n=1 Tax=unclassified Sphingomonas TaxID=196159 RepID=UPI0010F4A585|nr:PEPxxWA-CTERM sorting domain-containing protein [Sphingomonas sp. 3P27F8]